MSPIAQAVGAERLDPEPLPSGRHREIPQSCAGAGGSRPDESNDLGPAARVALHRPGRRHSESDFPDPACEPLVKSKATTVSGKATTQVHRNRSEVREV